MGYTEGTVVLRFVAYVISGIMGAVGGFFGVSAIEPSLMPIVDEVAVVATSTPVSTTTPVAPAPTPKTSAPAPVVAPVTAKAPTTAGTVPLNQNFFKSTTTAAAPKPTVVPSAAQSLADGPPSRDGIIAATNKERTDRRLGALTSNPKLTQMAEAKVNDMFVNQYFAHDSPTGVTLDDLAENAEYVYLLVGENLAQGTPGYFKSSRIIVDEWMLSKPHRENLLKDQYTEIGVAVKTGTYKGRTFIMAVQEFGLPMSVCSEPNNSLMEQIEEEQAKLTKLEALIAKYKKASEDAPEGSTEQEKAVDAHNEAVSDYNELAAIYKVHIATYNKEVNNYNDCLDEHT